ncbi:MAG: radical SAM-linked protein [Acidimicrobiales bacterium]|jgi:radical SAM-linked protein
MTAVAPIDSPDTRGIANPQHMRLRVRFTKEGKIRFVSHRDLARLMERAFRKLRLPVAYTEGFSPRPKFSFGLALSVGHESEAEYLDVELATSVDLENLPPRLTAALPDGIAVTALHEMPPGADSLQQAIVCCSWRIKVLGAPYDDVAAAVSAVLAAPTFDLERERKGKTSVVDIRPAILELHAVEPSEAGPTDNGVQLVALLATEQVSLRPAELLRVLCAAGSPELSEGTVRRITQWTMVDGVRSEPISLPNSSTAHTQPCAS